MNRIKHIKGHKKIADILTDFFGENRVYFYNQKKVPSEGISFGIRKINSSKLEYNPTMPESIDGYSISLLAPKKFVIKLKKTRSNDS